MLGGKIKVATYQGPSIKDNFLEVVRIIESTLVEIAQNQVDIVLFPELFLTGYDCGVEKLKALAIDSNHEHLSLIREIAIRHTIAICLGYSELFEGQVYNSAILIDSAGKTALNYRKTHLWDPEELYEKAAFVPGDCLPVANLYLPRVHLEIVVGILICFDVEFPEPARVLALTGANLLLVPTAVIDSFPARYMVPCRAVENLVFVAYSNFCGPCAITTDEHFCGQSGIFSPHGVELARASEEFVGVLIATLDADEAREYIRRNNYMKERKAKTTIYSPISQQHIA